MEQIEIVTQSELRKGDILLVQDSDDAIEGNGRIHILTVEKGQSIGGRISFAENRISETGARRNVVHMHFPKPGRSIVRIGKRHSIPVICVDAEIEMENDLFAEEERLRGFDQGFACAVANLVRMHGHLREAEDVYATIFHTAAELKDRGVDASDIEVLLPVIKRITDKKKRKRAPKRTDVRKCRVCGCTEEDCSGCIERTGSPCYWVEKDLCSACKA